MLNLGASCLWKMDVMENEFKIKVAVLVDIGFFLKRFKDIFNYPQLDPEKTATALVYMANQHVGNNYLYRVFCYDCLPHDGKAHNPVNKKVIDFSKSDVFKFRVNFHACLKKKRKFALRLGYLKRESPGFNWMLRKDKLKGLLSRDIVISDLKDGDVFYDLRQKGVDIKIGLDIASLAYKKLVDKIVLVSGDGDFVPAAKVARREGIDFVLDPMWNHINDSLFEHIDGLYSPFKKMEEKSAR